MSIIPFDPLTYARKLEDAGIIREQAEVQAHALKEYMDRQTALTNELLEKYEASNRKDLATKSDLLEVRNDLQMDIQKARTESKEDIQNVRTEMQALRTELKEDIQNVRTELKEDIQNVRTEMQAVRTELKQDIHNVQIDLTSKMDKITHDMIKWHISSIVTIAALMLGFFEFFMR